MPIVNAMPHPHMTVGFKGGSMRKGDTLSDAVIKTAYFSIALAVLVFLSLLVLTTLHP